MKPTSIVCPQCKAAIGTACKNGLGQYRIPHLARIKALTP